MKWRQCPKAKPQSMASTGKHLTSVPLWLMRLAPVPMTGEAVAVAVAVGLVEEKNEEDTSLQETVAVDS